LPQGFQDFCFRLRCKTNESDAYIEKTAREKIGLVKPGETRVVTVAPGTQLQVPETPANQDIIAD
jgi:hypothetical protein